MYIYNALFGAPSAYMIHTDLNTVFFTHVDHSPTDAMYVKYHLKDTLARARTHTHWHLL